ncbi:MAG: thiol:disulfide interchange protein DsbA/DsbL [Gammaproteobacteria bacterium]|nr:thiol:disulfide interchange protein DsbA/DsbL [Gammaproteobacteria bacterium]MBU1656002.1 thiol:disulfide interchange protein DsbA/DsbL [Gammaproteobacteria bacterium]MBU1962210.1 thiol:disulfide interchange protein DsbA/DsbL [Gammaproteobacteria bacterium]
MRKTIHLIVLLFVLVPALSVAAEKFQENINYFEIFPNYPGEEQGKLEVLEFFWYNCPHCKDIEPHLLKWLERKPEGVTFNQIPVIFMGRDGHPNAAGKLHAETFYALEMMGKLEGLHEVIFSAIHEQGLSLNSPEAMEKFLAEKGVDAEQFRNTRQSFAVQTRVSRSIELARRFGIDGVPSLVVGGIYRSGSTDSFEEKTALVDFLIARVKAEQASAAKTP